MYIDNTYLCCPKNRIENFNHQIISNEEGHSSEELPFSGI